MTFRLTHQLPQKPRVQTKRRVVWPAVRGGLSNTCWRPTADQTRASVCHQDESPHTQYEDLGPSVPWCMETSTSPLPCLMTPGPRGGAEVSSHLYLLKEGGLDRYRCIMVDQKKKKRIRASVEGSPEPAALVQTQGGRFKILSSQNPIQSTKNGEKPSVCVLSHFSRIRLFGTPWTVAHQAPLSMGFSRPEYWSGLPCPSPGDLPDPGIEPVSPVAPALQADSLPLSHRGSPSCGLHDKDAIKRQ